MTAPCDPEWQDSGPCTTSNVSKAGLVEETRLYPPNLRQNPRRAFHLPGAHCWGVCLTSAANSREHSGNYPANVAPLQKAGLLAGEVLNKKDIDKAIADRAR